MTLALALRMLRAVAISIKSTGVKSGQQEVGTSILNRVITTVRALLPSTGKGVFLAVQRFIIDDVVMIVDENMRGWSQTFSALEVVHKVPMSTSFKRSSYRTRGGYLHKSNWDAWMIARHPETEREFRLSLFGKQTG